MVSIEHVSTLLFGEPSYRKVGFINAMGLAVVAGIQGSLFVITSHASGFSHSHDWWISIIGSMFVVGLLACLPIKRLGWCIVGIYLSGGGVLGFATCLCSHELPDKNGMTIGFVIPLLLALYLLYRACMADERQYTRSSKFH